LRKSQTAPIIYLNSRYEETAEQHATRLGQTQRWTKIRRRALLLKLDGL